MPKGVSLARLYYPPTKSEIIICAVKRRALLHSSYVNDLLFDMQPECTFIQFAPDDPLFIKPEGDSAKDFRLEWRELVRRGKHSRFFVNPHPKYTSEVILTNEKVRQLMNHCLKPAIDEYEITPKVLYSPSDLKHSALTDRPIPDAFLTPLLYSYNTLSSTATNPRVIAIGDMPTLVQKEIQARALNIDQCQQIF